MGGVGFIQPWAMRQFLEVIGPNLEGRTLTGQCEIKGVFPFFPDENLLLVCYNLMIRRGIGWERFSVNHVCLGNSDL